MGQKVNCAGPWWRTVAPKIAPFQVDPTLRLGERLTLTCAVTKGDAPLRLGWLVDGRPAVDGVGGVRTLLINAFTSLLAVDSLSAANAGNYTCLAANAAAGVSQSQLVLIQVPPFWVVEPRDVGVLAGQSARLDCRADGYPTPNVTWFRVVPGGVATPLTAAREGGVGVSENGTLHIRSARQTLHQGRYECRAVNGIGQQISAIVAVVVNAGPRFLESVTRLAVKRDSSATLHCRVHGDKPLHVAWRRSSSASSAFLSSNYRLRLEDRDTSHGQVSTLTLNDARVDDAGVYVCIAANAHGQLERLFHLSVQEPPEQPRYLQVREAFSRRVSLSWLPPDGRRNDPVVAYIVQYKEASHGGAWQETEKVAASDGGGTVDGLQPSTSYVVRVVAETSAGRGPPSEPVTAATHGEPPGGAPADLRATPTSSTSLRLTWSAVAKGRWHSHLIGYHVAFRPENSMSYNFTTIPLTDHHTTIEFGLFQLRKFAKYVVAVRAFNRYGDGDLTPAVTVATLQDVPSATPTSVRCSATSARSMDVSWQPPPSSDHNGLIQTYRVHYEPLLTQYDVAATVAPLSRTVDDDDLQLAIDGLRPFTTYRVRVEAATEIGAGPPSAAVTCRTAEAAPGPPAEVKAFSATPSSLTLCWSPPLQSNGDILLYTLSIKPNGGHANLVRHSIPGRRTWYEVHNLTGHASYELWLTATTRAGVGDKSKVLRHSLNVKASSTAVCSFGRRLTLPWKSRATLPCQTVAASGDAVARRWTFNGQDLAAAGLKTSPGGAAGRRFENGSHLVLQDLRRRDAGNYSCTVGGDTVTYQLTVLGPPAAPVLSVAQIGRDHLILHWKTEEGVADAGSAHLLLHWRKEGGDWQERPVDRSATTARLDNLQCGTRYQVFVTSQNAVGSSGPSNAVTARTQGDVPLVLALSAGAVTVHADHVAVHLSGWQERGCPITSFGLDYRIDGETLWLTVSDDIQNLPTVFIEDLQPSTAYNVRVKARTSAGNVLTEYDLVTLDHTGAAPAPERVNRAGRPLPSSDHGAGATSGHVVLPWWLIAAVSTVGTASLLGLAVACYCLYKTRSESLRLTSALPSESTLMQVDANTWAKPGQQRHQRHPSSTSYNHADRLSSSRSGSVAYELQAMVDHHDDIYPYATFELRRHGVVNDDDDDDDVVDRRHGRPGSPVKLRQRPPDLTRLKLAPPSKRTAVPVPLRPPPPPPCWSELSTIAVERHFQGSPTVSDSDLELPPPQQQQQQQRAATINGRRSLRRDAGVATLKRTAGAVQGDYASVDASTSMEPNFYHHHSRSRPKKQPLLSNLWSGDPNAPWRPALALADLSDLSNGGHAAQRQPPHHDSPSVDHSIAV